ncbi:uncharacterized protein isoform X2 [Musca autumnalis]|uniref:uncharacterized protein isoform X2 n=1 Tax=Musca autumnalis TaxID=221902 RepID=UPI003CE9581C
MALILPHYIIMFSFLAVSLLQWMCSNKLNLNILFQSSSASLILFVVGMTGVISQRLIDYWLSMPIWINAVFMSFMIPLLIAAFCILQWPMMEVNSASTAVSSQLSYGQSNRPDQPKDGTSTSLLGTLYKKSRQSRCVTCYDDRYDDRRQYGGYSRTGDDRPSSWYYPRNDRYEDRYRDRDVPDYDRYSYDRYETRGGSYRRGSYGGESRGYGYDNRDDYDRRYGYGGYSEKRGYDRGEMRGYGYDSRDRYYGGGADRGVDYPRGADYPRGSDYSRGADYPRDRIYDRSRYGAGSGSYGYDRDYYDRYSPSPAYGALLDRGSNLIAVEPAKANEDGQENSEQSSSSSSSSSATASLDDNGQQNANGQSS